jgi:hypothetical protein
MHRFSRSGNAEIGDTVEAKAFNEVCADRLPQTLS